jgi:predicted ATPase
MTNTALFAGRVEELQALFQALGQAESGKPRVLMIEGAAGLGKTALLSVFAERAALRLKSGYVCHVRPTNGSVYRPVPQAAAEATNNQLYDRVGGRRSALQTARELLPDWLGTIPGVGDLIAAIVATVQALRSRRRRSVPPPVQTSDDACDALLAAAASHPLVLLLDDLHRAEPAAIEQLERLLRGTMAGHQLLIVGAFRAAAPGHSALPIQRLLQSAPPEAVLRLGLRELEAQELGALVTKRFPYLELTPSFLQRLVESTGGQPHAIGRTLDEMVDRSVIRFVDRRWQLSTEPQDLVRNGSAAPEVDLSGVRLPVVAVLRVASFLGEEFDGSTLAALLEQDELYVEDQLSLAARDGLVEVRGELTTSSGEIATLFRFSSGAVRAALVREIPPEERAELRRRQAELAASS